MIGARVTRTAIFLAISSAPIAAHAQSAADVPALLEEASVRQALDLVKKTESTIINDAVRFCEVPAPPFKEAERAAVLKAEFERAGLANVRIDRTGNVLGERTGGSARPRIVLAAHLDTVFPEGTSVK